MKRSRILVALTVLVLMVAAPAGAAREVPIKGTVMGEHGPPDFSAPGCAAGFLWRFSSEGEGQMSHLGRVDYALTQCSRFGPGGIVLSEGTVTFTAANDDTLIIDHEMRSQLIGDFDPDPDGFTLEGEWTAAGGTGRFAHATGSGSLDGVGDIPDGEAPFGIPDGLAQFNFRGEIAYAASDRSAR